MEFRTKSTLYHDFIKTFETNLHHINPMFDLLALEDARNIVVRHLGHFGLLAVASIPISVQSLEFLIACVKHYNPNQAADGRVVCSLKSNVVEKCFSIPPWSENLVAHAQRQLLEENCTKMVEGETQYFA